MSTLGDLLAEHTVLPGSAVDHLHAVVGEWQLLADLSFADYLMPTATDFPAIRGKFLNLAPAPGNPLGAKGGGEGGLVAVAGAVGNAISAALASFNVQVRELPVSPPRLWEMTRKAGK